MLRVIIDGNNVLAALGLASSSKLPQAEQFLQKLERIAADSDWEVRVVFDGRERFLPREDGILVVQYARPGSGLPGRAGAKPRQAADTVIERLVYTATDRTQIVVVTQDRAEADLVLGLGGRVWNVERLLQEMNKTAEGGR